MIELLRAAAAQTPEHPAIVTADRAMSYADLVRHAETAAAELRYRGIDRFAVFDPDPATTWMLLAAASLAGAEACVYPSASTDEALARLRERLDHKTLVTPAELDGEGLVAPAELIAGDERWTDEPAQGTRPLLVLTTGTSGNPQAAQHDWVRLLRAADKIVPTPRHRWLLAYGLNQFGGLQILLHAAAAHATLVAAESVQPRDGLAAMRRWGVTHASGTPTFWRFVLAELRSDGGPVPALQQVTLGGEAVPSALIGQLTATFADARISQIYGATELGQNITVRDGLAGLPLSVLDQAGDVEFKIVDDELWARSQSAMLGYFGQDRIAVGEWRPTGDLVEVVGARIMFRGRRSETINVGGVKVHPLPIEEVVSNVDGVALAHVFGRSNPMVGQIVALEVVPVAGADREALREAIRVACQELPPAARPRSIRFVTTMNIAGNKVARGKQ